MKVFCTLTQEQASLYEAVVTDMLAPDRATAEGTSSAAAWSWRP